MSMSVHMLSQIGLLGDEGTLYQHEEISWSSLDLSRDINKPEQFTLLYFYFYFYSLVFTSHVIHKVLDGMKWNVFDEAEKFTSEMHDPCARSRYLQKRTKQEQPTGGTGVGPAKHPPKVKSEIFLQL